MIDRGCRGQVRQLSPSALDFGKMIPERIPRSAVFAPDGWHVWCPSMVRGPEGLYYLFFSRWPKCFGHLAWCTHSEIAFATSSRPEGPFVVQGAALPARGVEYWDGHVTHNTCAIEYEGKYYIYYTGNHGGDKWRSDRAVGDYAGLWENPDHPWWVHRNNQRIGVAVAEHPAGPWRRFEEPLIDVGPETGQSIVATPCVTVRPDGGLMMVYKTLAPGKGPFGGGVFHYPALAESPCGPFVRHSHPMLDKSRLFGTHYDFHIDDHFEWFQEDRYYAIVKDCQPPHLTGHGKALLLMESVDGLDWELSRHTLVHEFTLEWDDGDRQEVGRFEMPKLYLENGLPRIALFAVLVGAEEDPDEQSFDLVVPLRQTQ